MTMATTIQIWGDDEVNLRLKQPLEFAASQATLCIISGFSFALLRLFALYKHFVQDTTIEGVGEWKTHAAQHGWHEVEYFGVGGFEATFEVFAIGIEYTVFMVRTERFTDIFPDA